MHVYVDSSFEPSGFSGVGGLCVDSSGEVIGFFSEEIGKEPIELIQVGGNKTAVLEPEMVAISVAICLWKSLITPLVV